MDVAVQKVQCPRDCHARVTSLERGASIGSCVAMILLRCIWTSIALITVIFILTSHKYDNIPAPAPRPTPSLALRPILVRPTDPPTEDNHQQRKRDSIKTLKTITEEGRRGKHQTAKRGKKTLETSY